MRVEVPYERFDALAGRALVIADVESDGWLDVFAKNIGCAIRVIVYLSVNAQEKIVRGFQLLAFAVANEIVLLQIFQRARPIFEEGHPKQILEIAQTTAAVLQVRLLHAG